MERLRLRTFILAATLIVAGVLLQVTPKAHLLAKDEKFMEQQAPVKVGKFNFEPGQANRMQSYGVDERTYELLKPFGVVGRVYVNGPEAYDVLLISGNDKNSFHDNRVCFQGQGYTITDQVEETIQTPRGPIPVTFLTLSHQERGPSTAAMFYKGPKNQWFALPQPLTFAMLKEQWKLGTDLNSTFYRVIPQHSNPDPKAFRAFISDYVVEAEKSSKGFF